MTEEEFLATKKNVKELHDRYIFDCDCKSDPRKNKQKAVLYKNNLKYSYCSHDKTGRPTGITEITAEYSEFQQRKEDYYRQHGLDVHELIRLGLIDERLNAILKGTGKKKILVDSDDKLRFSCKGVFKKDVGDIYPIFGSGKRLYLFGGDFDYLKGALDGLTCSSPIHGEGTNITSKTTLAVLSRFEEIALVYDADEPGRKARTKTHNNLKPRLPRTKVGYIELSFKDSEQGKDYCDWRHNHTVKEFRSLPVKGIEPCELDKPDAQPIVEAEEMPVIKSAESLLATEFAPIKWAVPKILPEGTSILAGKPKMGKSAWALNIALSIICGGKALGEIQVEKGEVLYFSLEDGERRLKDRIQQILRLEESPLDISGLHYATAWPKNGLKVVEKWLKDHQRTRLVIVDTLAKIRPPQRGGENIYDRDYQSVQGIKQIADAYSVSILILHHVRKGDADDALETISGSFGLSGAVDGVMVLKRERGKADAVLHITGREMEEKEFALQFSFPLWTLLGDAEEHRLSQERQTILSTLHEAEEALPPKEIYQKLKEHEVKCTEVSIRKLLSKMVKDGHLKNINGRYKTIQK